MVRNEAFADHYGCCQILVDRFGLYALIFAPHFWRIFALSYLLLEVYFCRSLPGVQDARAWKLRPRNIMHGPRCRAVWARHVQMRRSWHGSVRELQWTGQAMAEQGR